MELKKRKISTYGKHIGHYKAVMKYGWLSWLFLKKGEIPTISGYAPLRHRTCVDLMIMKNDNHFEYTSQRNFGMLDTELNNNNNIVAKITRDNGLQLHSIAAE